MDSTVRRIYDYSNNISTLNKAEIKEELKKRMVDSFFVSFAARNSDPVSKEMSALYPSKGKYNSSIYFTKKKAEMSISTMLNGSMTRYLDYNDTYLSKEALHPSDNIPPLMAASEALEVKGSKLLDSIALSYSVVCGLSDAVSIRDRGWDHVTYISLSSSAGLAHLADLDESSFENCLSLAINNNISMRQTRAGELSMWKGLTASNATRNSVFALELAMNGVTGPSNIFDGEFGFFKQVSGRFDLSLDINKIKRTMIKNYPVEYHAMSAVETCSGIREKLKGSIKKIKVDTFAVADRIIIKDPEKKRPKTKETADHSMPYLIAYTLLYGDPTPESYSPKYLKDPAIISLIDLMDFSVTKDIDEKYPEHLPFRIKIETENGKIEDFVLDPKGYFSKPFNWDDLRAKGYKLMQADDSDSIIESVRSIDNRQVSEILEILSDVNN